MLIARVFELTGRGLTLYILFILMKILIVRLSAIGDVVHTLPSLNALRTAFPDSEIHWLVEELSAPVLKGHPQLDRIHVFRKKWRKSFMNHLFSDIVPFFKKLRREKFNWAVEFQGLTKSGLAAYLSGARKIIGYGDKDGRELNKLFTNKKVRPSGIKHVVERNLALLRPLGIKNPTVRFVFPDYSEDMPEIPDEPFAIVNPGAGWPTKRLPPETLARLCSDIYKQKDLPFVIAWGPREKNLAETVKSGIEDMGGKAVLAPPTNLRQLAAMISRCQLFTGGDTGPTHIAAAMDIPVVSFFGASDAKRNAPYGKKCLVVQKDELSCISCWKKQCPLKGERHLHCLRKITADELYECADSLLEKKNS